MSLYQELSIEELNFLVKEHDDIDAEIQLAWNYAFGYRTDQDLNEAAYWYYIATRVRSTGDIARDLDAVLDPNTDDKYAWRQLYPIKERIESVEFVVHGDTLVKCHPKSQQVIIPHGIKKIGARAFGSYSNSYKFESFHVTLPEGITEIGEFAFSEMKITSVEIPYGVKTLGRGALSASGIESIVIPEGVSEIPDAAFGDGLRSITIPTSVRRIGREAFNLLDHIPTVNYQGTKEQWKRIVIEKFNTKLKLAKKNYNYSYAALIGRMRPPINQRSVDRPSNDLGVGDQHNDLADAIVSLCGGTQNILNMEYCLTRLRIRAKENAKVNENMLKVLPGVRGVVKTNNGLIQIIIGDNVAKVYNTITQKYQIRQASESQRDSPQKHATDEEPTADTRKPMQSLHFCLRCGRVISRAVCPSCGYQNSQPIVFLLEEKLSRDLHVDK